ncbi:MAG: pyridoxamine 5'-phosphate oxidase family protein [Alphaproteobacteria bacterium]|nr:pyridoxamine 5'-phosphate oxidase family protein [Alphaproteobacteria bacterium]
MPEEFFTPFHRDFQKQADGEKVADAIVERRVHVEITPEEKDFIESSHFFFIATGAGEQIDCSYKGGEPGFVRVTGPSQVTWPDYDGNLMFRTLGNIVQNPNVSMIFVNFKDPSKVASPKQIGKIRLNGKARVVEAGENDGFVGAKHLVVVDLDFVLPNCPRYLPDMSMVQSSKYNPQDDYVPPDPEWKGRDYIKPLLKK